MKKVTLLMALILFCSWQFVLAQKTITGTVTDANDGSVLPGVSVVVKGTTTGTVTDVNGAYSLKASASITSLLFSFIGYTTQEVAVNGQSTINVALQPVAAQLSEVVVTALGIRRDQRALGYAMSSVDAKSLTKTGSSNFGSALYGKAAGVRIAAAPGGATSAVTINIRGINSLTGNTQPLIIVDGVPIRNEASNNNGYWGDPRIRGNGLLDINPEDIANVSILKGASAAALYGSEAANGVVLITTKSGKGVKQGLGVEFNATYAIEKAAYLPKYQNEFGPGYDRNTNVGSFGSDDEGWLTETVDGKQMQRPIYRAYSQFGPKFDGREVIGWDSQPHPYVAQENNYADFYRTGTSGTYNIAATMATEKSNFRFSYTRNDYKGIQIGGDMHNNTFSMNGQFKIHPSNVTDITMSYINKNVHNRPEQIGRIMANYGGFFSRFDDMQWYFDNYKTSLGYKYVTGTNPSLTPDENLIYRMRAYDLMDFMWRQQENSYDEKTNRIIGSITNTQEIMKGLKLRGRIATDYTSYLETNKNPNEVPLALGTSGYFSQAQTQYGILYGDVLLMLDKKITEDIGIIVNAGWQGRKESSLYNSAGTNGGLSVENWYDLNATNLTPTVSATHSEFIKQAFLGTLGLSYKSFAYLEVTGRQESSSTLPPASNTFFYPSVNGSLILSEMFKMPEQVDYAKIRASWGIVGNAPALYAANNAFNQSNLNGIIYNSITSAYGNDMIRPEEKHEFEIGLETKFFKDRLGFEFSYYDSKIVDQILPLTVPFSTGAASMLANVGTLSNKGVEVSLYGTPVLTPDFRWDVRLNYSHNDNKVVSLMEGVDVLTHASYDADAARLVSRVGHSVGDFMMYMPVMKDGQYVIDNNGMYKIDFSEMKTVGNYAPKAVGGFGNTLSYKAFTLDFTIDYRFGGQMMSLPNQYLSGAGMFESTLFGRDKDHGGLAYYVNGDGQYVRSDAAAGPNGEKIYNDGIILEGVKADGSPNDVVIDAANYYLTTFTWGANASWAPNTRYDNCLYDNSYIKFRELSLAYNLPKEMVSKIGFQSLQLSVIGRNLFYLYKTIPNLDPEVAIGSLWQNQAVEQGTNAASRSFGFSIRASF